VTSRVIGQVHQIAPEYDFEMELLDSTRLDPPRGVVEPWAVATDNRELMSQKMKRRLFSKASQLVRKYPIRIVSTILFHVCSVTHT